MQITTRAAKTILTAQHPAASARGRGGFLASPPHPFTHTLSPYTGCGFGRTTCGLYCYAQFLPNWTFNSGGAPWGGAVAVKENAAALLDRALGTMDPAQRRALRIFMSSTTDPYQPVERHYGITRRCLEVFARHDDLDLLVLQTRAPLAERDFDLIRRIPYAWLSVTIETDDEAVLRRLRGGPPLARRFALIGSARRQGIAAQITVSPCLPHSEDFAAALAASGARRVVVDTFVEGDGAGGERTARSPYAALDPSWRDPAPARALHNRLAALGVATGWSATGFCGIPPRNRDVGAGPRACSAGSATGAGGVAPARER